jgi:ketosteroid isomerase-like protein
MTQIAAAQRREIEALEAKRCAALVAGDVGILSELLADDLVHVHGGGSVDDRAGYLAGVAERFVFHAVERGPLNIRIFGDVAIVTGPLKQTLSVKGSGDRLEVEGPTTQVWVRTERGWVQNTCHNNFAKRSVVPA